VNPIGTHVASIAGLHLPPPVALLLTIAFVSFLFRRDIRERPNITSALWILLIWMLMVCSRGISQWLNILGVPLLGGSPEQTALDEGTPLDACVYFALIAAGLYVLNKRQINLSEIIQKNGWLIAFLLYCFIAILWADFPFIAFKRWVKILGLPIMALVLFTEPDFEEALARLIKRSAYVLIPFSILVIKYYPEIGIKYDAWTGVPVYRGIAQSKNMMGCDCLILGLFFFWHFLKTRRTERTRSRRGELLLIGSFMAMICWVLRMIQSSTSMICLLVGVLVMTLLGTRFVDKRLIGAYIALSVAALLIAELSFGISQYVIEFLHKDPTLTDRTRLWADILKIKINPIFGAGFESFWLGDRLIQLHEGRAFQPNEAHNGYLETYINLGLPGLFILIAAIGSAYRKIRGGLLREFEFSRFRLGVLAAIVLYNFTEASFTGPQVMWLVFYIIALDYPRVEYEPAAEEINVVEYEGDAELSYFEERL
jgi:exopolysaccharide production protein ExoQ